MQIQLNPTSRHWLRSLLYSAVPRSLLRRAKRPGSAVPEHETVEYWNTEAPRLMSAADIDCMVGNAIRDRATASLLRYCGPVPRRVLDIGCAFGRLADALVPDGLEDYLGVDLSDRSVALAIEEHASDRMPRGVHCRFLASDLRDLRLEDEPPFSAVVFNEVLYYLDMDQAVDQCARYANHLDPGGIICVSMKDDAKSRALFKELRRRFTWVHGAIFQLRGDGPRYRITRNRETPASLIGVFRPEPAKACAA